MPDLRLIMHISRCHFGEKKFCVITFVFPNPSRPESFLLLGVGGFNNVKRGLILL